MFNYNVQVPAITGEKLGWFDYYMRLKALACTMIEWVGLPETCNARALENSLFERGVACFFNDDSLGYLTLPCAISGVDVYDEPNRFTPTAPGYTFEAHDLTQGVIIRNTPDCVPTVITALRYADALFNLDGARDVNLEAQKTPVLILATEKQRRSLETVYEKYKGNQPVIFGVKDILDPNSFKCIKTDAPFVAGQIQDMKLSIYNEYITFLGLGQVQEKAERLISGEVDQTERQTSALAEIYLTPRMEACKLINQMYGLDVSVKLRSDLEFSVPNYNRNNTAVTYNFTSGGMQNNG